MRKFWGGAKDNYDKDNLGSKSIIKYQKWVDRNVIHVSLCCIGTEWKC